MSPQNEQTLTITGYGGESFSLDTVSGGGDLMIHTSTTLLAPILTTYYGTEAFETGSAIVCTDEGVALVGYQYDPDDPEKPPRAFIQTNPLLHRLDQSAYFTH